VVGTRIERRGCSLTWVAGASYKGLYVVSFTLYRADGGWRVKREIKLRPKRSQEERILFVEDYSLPEFQAISESCQALASEVQQGEEEFRLALALKALAAINLLVKELGGGSR
jgi:hypothetical protein